MTSTNLHHRLWHLAWPMMLSNITVPLLGLVDTAVLGHLDNASYLAGVALSTTLFTSVFWLFGFLRMGTCGMTAQAVGQENTERILKLLLSAFWFALIIGLMLVLCQSLWLPFGLELLSGQASANNSLSNAPLSQALADNTQNVITNAQLYADWRVLGAPLVLLNYGIIGWFIGRQNTKVPLLMLIFANLINILLDLLLVVYFDMAVEGVAIATLSADVSATLLGLGFIYKHYREEWSQLKRRLPDWQVIQEMIQVNRYIFVRTGTLLLTFAIFTAQGARLGDEMLAANAVLMTFLLLISSALDGFAHGAEALVGEACGKRDRNLVSRVINISVLWSALAAILLFGLFVLGGGVLINLLTDLDSIRLLAGEYLVWLVWMPILATWCYTFDGIFIGATKVKAMQNIMLICTFIVFIPLVILVPELLKAMDYSLTNHEANHLLWFAMALFMLCRSAGMAVVCQQYSRRGDWFSA